jgi:putative transcriptional regulator
MKAYDSITKGLNEALQYEKGERKSVRVHRVNVSPVPQFNSETIKAIRTSVKMTQQTFAEVLGVSKKTVEAWESGKNEPAGPASRILEMLQKDTDILEKYSIISYS